METNSIDSYFSGYVSFLEESGMAHLIDRKKYGKAREIETTDPGFDDKEFLAGEIQGMKETIRDLFNRIHQLKGENG